MDCSSLRIRPFVVTDAHRIKELFRDTVYAINAKDYTKEQIQAWAPTDYDVENWEDYFTGDYFYIAEIEGTLVGFGSITDEGWINKLYTHKDYQGLGIGSKILCKLEEKAMGMGLSSTRLISTITAKAFYENQGYICREVRPCLFNGVAFDDYVMEKLLNV